MMLTWTGRSNYTPNCIVKGSPATAIAACAADFIQLIYKYSECNEDTLCHIMEMKTDVIINPHLYSIYAQLWYQYCIVHCIPAAPAASAA